MTAHFDPRALKRWGERERDCVSAYFGFFSSVSQIFEVDPPPAPVALGGDTLDLMILWWNYFSNCNTLKDLITSPLAGGNRITVNGNSTADMSLFKVKATVILQRCLVILPR